MTDQTTTTLAIATVMNEQPGTMICSIDSKDATQEQRKTVFNAMNNPTHKLSDFINKKIKVENVLIEVVDYLNEETGEIDRTPKTVLIAPDGTSYFSMAKGVFNSVKNAFTALGPAPWKDGIEFEVKQKQVGRGKMLTLEMV